MMTKNTMRIAVFAGDGIGPEVTEQAVRVLEKLNLKLDAESILVEDLRQRPVRLKPVEVRRGV